MSVQLLGISNAIVDILANVEPEFLEKIDAPAGSMTLIDEKQAREIYKMMGPATEMSGGSVANTVAGFANLGGSAAYIGNVCNDQLGDIFVHDMQSLGVDVRLPPATGGSPTARSHILITPDGQRTMQTYLGACTELKLADITAGSVGEPDIALLEGYVWDIPEGPALCAAAAELVRKNGGKVALSLSDSFCVERHLKEFADFVEKHVDLVFADEDELLALYELDSFDDVAPDLAERAPLYAVTRSEKGSVIYKDGESVQQDALAVEKLVDTTGAGDAYTAGFLYAYADDKPLDICARAGTICATRVIQQVGARIEKNAMADFDLGD
ncbi:MAG: adenosine kinase [Woeseia sp.]|nr:adenosine kinase [Woeseia sp.]NNE62110.1 adenosine kinase [Woeseia sp.]